MKSYSKPLIGPALVVLFALVASCTPPVGSVTVNYDLADDKHAFGAPVGATAEAAIRLRTSLIGSSTGKNLTAVMIYFAVLPDSTTPPPVLKIYAGNTTTTPGAVLRLQYLTAVALGWNTISLASPVPVSNSDLWVSIQFTSPGTSSSKPAFGTDDGAPDPDGGFWYQSPTWTTLVTMGFNYNWNIRAVLS